MIDLRSPLSLCEAGQADEPLEAVFRALDGHECDIDGDTCHVVVYGIYAADGHRWVQLAVDSSRHQMVTVRLGEGTDPNCALVSVADKAA